MFVKTVLFALLASPAAIAAATGLSDGQLSAREEIARSIEDDGDTGFDWSSRIVKSDKEETKLHGDAKVNSPLLNIRSPVSVNKNDRASTSRSLR